MNLGTRNELLRAEQQAIELFHTVEASGLIVPGKSERVLCDEIVEIAKRDFDVDKHWGKKIVRCGLNTLEPYKANPADRKIGTDDILFFDFHPVFNGWEADLGRTYVLGNDPIKWKIRQDVETAWQEANDWYFQQDKLTGAALFHYVTSLAHKYGYAFGNDIAGHIVGYYPHEQPDDPADLCLDVHPDNHADILLPDKNGNQRHWILELHFVDREKNIGAFFEQLLKPIKIS